MILSLVLHLCPCNWHIHKVNLSSYLHNTQRQHELGAIHNFCHLLLKLAPICQPVAIRSYDSTDLIGSRLRVSRRSLLTWKKNDYFYPWSNMLDVRAPMAGDLLARNVHKIPKVDILLSFHIWDMHTLSVNIFVYRYRT